MRPPVSVVLGWRSRRTPRPSRTSGTTSPTRPKVPATTACTTRPTPPRSPHHSTAATTVASPSSASPTPSRRCAGSRSRALLPTRRASQPTRWARPSQTARRPRPSRRPERRGSRRRGRVPRAAGPRPSAGRRDRRRRGRSRGRRARATPRPVERAAGLRPLLAPARGRVDVRVAMLAGYRLVTPASLVTRIQPACLGGRPGANESRSRDQWCPTAAYGARLTTNGHGRARTHAARASTHLRPRRPAG